MRNRQGELERWPSGGNRRRLEESWLRLIERDGLDVCLMDLPGEAPRELVRAVDDFNCQLFWECHETLEDLWLKTPYPLRFFYHSIIKVAVGFHHLGKHNRHGAAVKLADGVLLLKLYQTSFLTVRTDLLLRDAARWLTRVEGAGPIDWKALDPLPRPRILLEAPP